MISKINNMKKIFLSLFIIFISFTFTNAEEVKKTKELSSSEDDSSKKLLELQERMKKAQERVKKGQERDEKLNKLEKTVNELNSTLGIKK